MRYLFLLLLLCTSVAHAQQAPSAPESCTLQTYASSWMLTGTPFSVKCPSGVYTGTLIATSARHYFKRGHLVLKFDQPVAAIAPKNSEGVFQAGHGQQIANMFLAGGSGIGSKDITDGLSGVVFKSWYMIPITFTTIALFEKGGDVNLKPGYQIQVVPSRAGDTIPLARPDVKSQTEAPSPQSAPAPAADNPSAFVPPSE